MKKSTFNALLIGGGFLLGTAGMKAVTSAPAKRAYVQGIACGIRAKNCYQDMVEQAKAEVDDMVAEATYLTSKPKADEAETEAAAE
ncbi:DUF6110 family protein [Slackia isoflavoniconvertens]|uniref:DUF1490 domain-containing protein n=1 Tax=Slackia isoflavoniconvertens TaxID=572010 RepID=A0A369LQP1_9ACTN|nr:DUF6110 family protein [Slackia isoflavoniconvertens]RDB60979.1 DUF1490 domain-containing protein [Slackia isoflavoniconvertens]